MCHGKNCRMLKSCGVRPKELLMGPPSPSLAVEQPPWRSVREAVLARDKLNCRSCGLRFPAAELDVHHLVPRKQGGLDDLSNLIALCDQCHAARHPGLQVGLARRMIERWALRLAKTFDHAGELPESLEELSSALRVFGKTRLRDGQLDVILAALAGKSLLVVRPTGAGKSLCFQLPAVITPGTTLVVSPLKALMSDQVSGLTSLKIPATFINSSVGPDEKELRYQLLESGAWKLVYCAPERFNPQLVRPEEVKRVSRLRPSYLVIDEAHCIDRWGDAFRPDYALLGELRQKLGNPPVLAFTATAGSATRDRILASLHAEDADRFIASTDRPNIALIRYEIASFPDRRAKFICRFLDGLSEGKVMIFVPTVKVGDGLRRAIAAQGQVIPFFHAKAGTANERENILGRFTGLHDPPLKAVICTNAFGMGIDVPDVRAVIHWQPPASVEDYLQEFGRAGRDGRPSVAILLHDKTPEWELRRLDFMAQRTVEAAGLSGADADDALKMKLGQIRAMSELARTTSCFRRDLARSLSSERPSRRTLSRRILDWVFSEKQKVARVRACCDHCDRKKIHSVLTGDLRPLG